MPYKWVSLRLIWSKMGLLHSSAAGCVFVAALCGYCIPLCVCVFFHINSVKLIALAEQQREDEDVN